MSWEDIYRRKGAVLTKQEPFYHGVLSRLRGKTALDLGCGTGRFAYLLAGSFKRVFACDTSPTALKILRVGLKKAGLANVVLKRGAFQKIPVPTASVDFVLCAHVLQHGTLKDIEKGVSEIARVLKPGGTVAVDLLDVRDMRNGRGKIIEPNTVIFDKGNEKGVPHHFSTLREARRLFSPRFRLAKLFSKTFRPPHAKFCDVEFVTRIYVIAVRK